METEGLLGSSELKMSKSINKDVSAANSCWNFKLLTLVTLDEKVTLVEFLLN